MNKWVVVLLVGCACPQKPPPGTGSGSGSGSAVASTCDSVKPKIEQLYRAEGQQREPKRVDEYVADNTHMVMADCAKQPDKAVPCITAAQSVPDLESKCLIPLDEEGTEGDKK
jgi:hypothetical protein